MRGQTEQGEVTEREASLVGEVVDREHRSGRARRVQSQHETREAGVPIVCVQDLRLPAIIDVTGCQMRTEPAEQGEALQVVAPFAACVVLIRPSVARVEIRGIDHVGGHFAAAQRALSQRHPRGAVQTCAFENLARLD